jgi:hypothetical protein
VRDIHSLSSFKRDTSKLMRLMKKTKEPVILTSFFSGLLAPENDEFDHEIRQLVVGRYRVCSTPSKRSASTFCTSGAYVSDFSDESESG